MGGFMSKFTGLAGTGHLTPSVHWQIRLCPEDKHLEIFGDNYPILPI